MDDTVSIEFGEVWWADLGMAAKQRPVLVLGHIGEDNQIIFVPITTQKRRGGQVDLPPVDFLPRKSYANVYFTTITSVERFVERCGRFDEQTTRAVERAARDYTTRTGRLEFDELYSGEQAERLSKIGIQAQVKEAKNRLPIEIQLIAELNDLSDRLIDAHQIVSDKLLDSVLPAIDHICDILDQIGMDKELAARKELARDDDPQWQDDRALLVVKRSNASLYIAPAPIIAGVRAAIDETLLLRSLKARRAIAFKESEQDIWGYTPHDDEFHRRTEHAIYRVRSPAQKFDIVKKLLRMKPGSDKPHWWEPKLRTVEY